MQPRGGAVPGREAQGGPWPRDARWQTPHTEGHAARGPTFAGDVPDTPGRRRRVRGGRRSGRPELAHLASPKGCAHDRRFPPPGAGHRQAALRGHESDSLRQGFPPSYGRGALHRVRRRSFIIHLSTGRPAGLFQIAWV